jgi:RNA polymerase sigma-70 factor (ECF subfamily)
MVLLETLSPEERAVFLLREVFDHEYDEIAAMLDTTPANCRQLFHRAKTRIAERRPRFRDAVDAKRPPRSASCAIRTRCDSSTGSLRLKN